MNIERFHAIAAALQEEVSRPLLADELDQLVTSLEQAMREPAQPSHQQAVSSLRKQLGERLAQAPSNRFSPAWRQALVELGIADQLGDALRSRVEAIFAQNEITPATAAQELGEIAQRIRALSTALDQVLAGVEFFSIGAEELGPGEFELGFLIPREAVNQEIEQLGQEFIQIKRILGPFQELSTGTRPNMQVRSIGSSAFEVFLLATPALMLTVAKAIESLVTSYETILTIRQKRKELKDAGVPDTVLEPLLEHAETIMLADIEALVERLLAEHAEVERGRANELRTELKGSLNAIANRIDRGYSVEIRAGDLPEESESDSEENASEDVRDITETVLSMQERLTYTNVTGKPILSLPEQTESPTASGDVPA